MKHVKRSDCRTKVRGAIMEYYYDMIEAEYDMIEAKELQNQIDQAWDAKERDEADRIKMETDASWKEYEAYKEALDKECNTNATTEIEEYFQSLEESGRFEESFHLMKDKKRSGRRRENAYAKRRLLTKAKNANRNVAKRKEDDFKNYVKITEKDPEEDGNDLKNLRINSRKEFKSRVSRACALVKKAKKLQP